MKEFSCKTRIVMGCPAAQVLKERNFDKIMVVSDPFFARNGMAQSLGQQAREFAIFDKVAPDPSVELVAQGVSLLQQFDPDGLVALGGGSAMDCAKAMRFFSGKNIPFLAVPTTSGSGSEVTDFAILTHNAVKHPLVDEKLRPDVAVLDENMVSSLPSGLIADGGFDVLTHALEAWVKMRILSLMRWHWMPSVRFIPSCTHLFWGIKRSDFPSMRHRRWQDLPSRRRGWACVMPLLTLWVGSSMCLMDGSMAFCSLR